MIKRISDGQIALSPHFIPCVEDPIRNALVFQIKINHEIISVANQGYKMCNTLAFHLMTGRRVSVLCEEGIGVNWLKRILLGPYPSKLMQSILYDEDGCSRGPYERCMEVFEKCTKSQIVAGWDGESDTFGWATVYKLGEFVGYNDKRPK